MSVIQDSEFLFRVPSDSDANKKYVVNITPGDTPTCTCTAFAIKRNKDPKRKGWCKHLDYVNSYVNDDVKKRQRAEKAEAEKVAVEFETIRSFESLKADILDLEDFS